MFSRFFVPTSDFFEAPTYLDSVLHQQQELLAALQYQEAIEQERQRRRRIYEQKLRRQQQLERERAQRAALNALFFNLPSVQQYFLEDNDDEEETEADPVFEIIVKKPAHAAPRVQQSHRQQRNDETASVNTKREANKKPEEPVTAKKRQQLPRKHHRAKVTSSEERKEVPLKRKATAQAVVEKPSVPVATQESKAAETETKSTPKRIRITIHSSEDENQEVGNGTSQITEQSQAPVEAAEVKESQPLVHEEALAQPEQQQEVQSEEVAIELPVAEHEQEVIVPEHFSFIESNPVSNETEQKALPAPVLDTKETNVPGDLLIITDDTPIQAPTAEPVNTEDSAPESTTKLEETSPSTPEQPSMVELVAPTERTFDKEQILLKQIGFYDEKLNEQLLLQFNGDLKKVVNALLSQ